MKVMLIGTDSAVSGAGLSMITLAECLKEQGINVVIVVKLGHTESILRKRGIEHYVIDCQSWVYSAKANAVKMFCAGWAKRILNIPAYFKYMSIMKKENPDIVHINTATSGLAGVVAQKLRKKIVWHIRELMEEDLDCTFAHPRYSKNIMAKSNAIITISKAVFNKYSRIFPITPMYLIYNGIDNRTFLNASHSILEKQKTVFTICGRIHQNKGQFEVVTAMKNILKKFDCELWIVGDGDFREVKRIKDYIKNNKIPEERIIFYGKVTNVPDILGKTDIAIVASRYEAFGRVTVEAMLSGCLVIGANSGGTAELIKHEKTGLLYQQGNPKDLEQKLLFALSHTVEMRSLADAGRCYAAKEFTSENNAKNIISVYEKVLKRDN